MSKLKPKKESIIKLIDSLQKEQLRILVYDYCMFSKDENEPEAIYFLKMEIELLKKRNW